MTTSHPILNASSTGQAATAADWLDAHFRAFRPEYEAAVRGVGLAPGWRVLDAGCGGGGYLPDAALARALAECRRVLRPGGLLAAKEMDGGLMVVAPADPTLLARLLEAYDRLAGQLGWLLRARDLHGWWGRAGFVAVRQRG